MRWHSSLYKMVMKLGNGLFYSAGIGPFIPTLWWPFLPDPNSLTTGPAHFRLESSVVVLDKRGNPKYNNNCYSITR